MQQENVNLFQATNPKTGENEFYIAESADSVKEKLKADAGLTDADFAEGLEPVQVSDQAIAKMKMIEKFDAEVARGGDLPRSFKVTEH